MTDQRIKDMEPLAAAQAIFAALGLVPLPTGENFRAYYGALVYGAPGAVLNLSFERYSSIPNGMFRAAVNHNLGHEFTWFGDGTPEQGITGNFSKAQTVESAAAAIKRRLLDGGKPEALIRNIMAHKAKLEAADAAIGAAIVEFDAAVWAERVLLDGGAGAAQIVYTLAQTYGAVERSASGAFTVSLYGHFGYPDVKLWCCGENQPVRCCIDHARSHVSFPTAAKICALVAFDKSQDN